MSFLTATPDPDTFIYAIAGHGETLFAAANTGLFRSTDGGDTWQSVTGQLGFTGAVAATSLAVAPDFDHQPVVYAGLAGGLLLSEDGGQTWMSGAALTPPPTITALALSPAFARDSVLLAGCMEDGVLRSADGGRRFSPWNFGLLDLSIYSLALSPGFSEDETLFVGAESGLFRSTNGGRAWREVDWPYGFETVLSLALSPDFGVDGCIYAGTESKGLLISRDAGKTWQPCDLPEGPVNALLCGPAGELAALCGGAAYLSGDAGVTWRALWPDQAEAGEITALFAPRGLASGSPVWVGLVGGAVERREIR